MDGRLIFRHRVFRLRLQRRREDGGPLIRRGSRKGEGVYDPEAPRVADEKSLRRTRRAPVLKLTQVGAMKIRRRSRERW